MTNDLMMHFSECIPIIKWRMTIVGIMEYVVHVILRSFSIYMLIIEKLENKESNHCNS